MNIHKLRSDSIPTNMDANDVKLDSNFLEISSQRKESNNAVTITHGRRPEGNWRSTSASILDQEQSPADNASICSTSESCEAPIVRQFWKAGVYDDELTSKAPTRSGSTYLHIHPRFLHSNATSHKWVFGAVAELIDNAVDEIQHGATFVHIDKTVNPRNGCSALLIQDDGSGMDPEAMRRCMSFGFSDKSSMSTIGKYGNGFKTSTMRLGADVIVFSRNISDRTMTQSIGLLSYTFLTREGYNRIVVPMVHYEFNFITESFDLIQSKNKDNSNLNMALLLRWSPYSTEEELLKQFEDVGSHGTKVIVYNLWLDEDRNMELDFESDPQDIRITRDVNDKIKDGSHQAVTEQHIANRLRYSLRAYLSILYLKLPETFAISLRGKVVLYRNIATDLKYTEFIVYKPFEGPVITTIGFVKEAPNVNVHGFNVYHKNRLILPFWPVVRFSANRGRGVVGILEANFIEPTHDKQDFEKTSIFQKLVNRLKEMTLEYWDYHCGLVGYQFAKKAPPATSAASKFIYQNGPEQPVPRKKFSAPCNRTKKPLMITTINSKAEFHSNSLPKSVQPSFPQPPMITTINSKAAFNSNSLPKPVQPSFPPGFQEGSNLKRKSSDQPTTFNPVAQMDVGSVEGSNLPVSSKNHEAIQVRERNKKLRAQCSQHEKAEGELMLKVIQLKIDLGAAQEEYARLLGELKYYEKVKDETTSQFFLDV